MRQESKIVKTQNTTRTESQKPLWLKILKSIWDNIIVKIIIAVIVAALLTWLGIKAAE